MPASTILLLDADPTYSESISAALTAVGYTVTTTADADEAFSKTPDNHLVILDVVTGPRSAAELCREIRNTATMAAIPVLCIGQSDDVEERIRFLEAGADDVIAKPFDPRELEARVEALLLRFQRSKDLAPVISADGLTMARRAGPSSASARRAASGRPRSPSTSPPSPRLAGRARSS